MDFFYNKEVTELKNEICASKQSLDAEKYSFANKLRRTLGDEILNELRNPSKPSFWLMVKIKFNRWRKKREDKKILRRIKKEGY